MHVAAVALAIVAVQLLHYICIRLQRTSLFQIVTTVLTDLPTTLLIATLLLRISASNAANAEHIRGVVIVKT
jgi:hypothetical protein